MAKKKSAKKKIDKELADIDQLKESLNVFGKHAVTLKDFLGKSIEDRDALIKMIDEASSEAHGLKNKLHNLVEKITGAKSKENSRFARRVVASFLNSSSI